VVIGRVHGGGVVLVVVEVPAGDVVRVTVAVVVAAVGEAGDDVLGIDQAVRVRVVGVGVVLGVQRAVVLRGGGRRQLPLVEKHPVGQLLRSMVPVDATLDVGDHGVGAPGAEVLPGGLTVA
jgi:hypothetical protein